MAGTLFSTFHELSHLILTITPNLKEIQLSHREVNKFLMITQLEKKPGFKPSGSV